MNPLWRRNLPPKTPNKAQRYNLHTNAPKGIFKTLFIKRMDNNGFMDSESADDSAFLEIKYLGFTFRIVLLEKM